MTDEQIALARRAVACPKWRWMPGMRTRVGWRVYAHRIDGEPIAMMDGDLSVAPSPLRLGPSLPDLTDPATLGCLLALVREVWGEPRTVVEAAKYGWGIVVGGRWIFADTEAEALVAALEAAP